jgi:hypothetical protein
LQAEIPTTSAKRIEASRVVFNILSSSLKIVIYCIAGL